MRNKKVLKAALAVAAAQGLWGAPTAHAVTDTWTATASGNWSTPGNWSGGTAPPLNGGSTRILEFDASGATTYTATNDRGNPFVLNGYVFNSTSSAAITLNNAASNALRFVVDGSTNPTITQSGSGAVTVDQSFTTLNDLSFIGAGTGLVTLGTSTRTLTLGANNLRFNTDTYNVAVGLGIQGVGGTITKDGLGKLTVASLSGNTYTGGVTLNAGIFELNGSNTSGNFTSGVLTSGPMGTGTLTINGGKVQSVSTTGKTLSNKIVIAADFTVGDATNTGTITFDGISFYTTPPTNPFTLTATANTSRTITTTSAAVFAGAMVQTNANTGLIKLGAATLTFGSASDNFANTFSGLTDIQAGEIDLAKVAGTTAIAGNLQVGGTGTILKLINSDQINNASTVTVNTGGTFNLNAKTETIASLTVGGGTVSGTTTSALTIAGAGTTTVTSGTVSVASLVTGTTGITLGDGATLSAGVTLNGNLTYNGTTTAATFGTAASTLNGNRDFTVADGAAATDLIVSAVIGDGATVPSAISKKGAGTMQVSGASTFTGGITLGAGTLELGGSSNTFASGALSQGVVGLGTLVLETGTLQSSATTARTIANRVSINGDLTFGGGTGKTGTLTFDAITGYTLPPTNAYTLTAPANTQRTLTFVVATSFAGAITQANTGAGIIKLGASTLTFGNSLDNLANTYTGLTDIQVGELDLAKVAGTNALAGNVQVGGTGTILKLINSDQIADTATVTVNTGGTFNLNTKSETIGNLTVGGGTVSSATSVLTIAGAGTAAVNGGTVSVATLVTGTGGLSMGDGATVSSATTLNGNVSYTGTTTGATFGTAAITLNGNRDFTVADGTAATDLTVSGLVSDGATTPSGITKRGAGALLLSTAANTFTGGLTIAAGSVTGTNAASFGTGAITIGETGNAAAATVTLGTAGPFTNAINVASGAGSRALAASTTVGASGAITLANSLTVTDSAGTFTLSGGVTGSGNLLFTATGSSAITLSSVATNNAGTITNQGTSTGTVTLSGGVGSSVTGLTLNSTTSALTVSGGLVVNNTSTTLTNTAGTKLLTVSGNVTGSGALILKNDSSTAAGITLSGATVSNTGVITNSGAGSGSVSITAVIDSAAGVVQNSSSSTLSLGAVNTFAGGVTIKAGTVQTISTGLGSGTVTLGDTSGSAAATLASSGGNSTIANNLIVQQGTSGAITLFNSSAGGGNTGLSFSGRITLNNNLILAATAGNSGLTLNGDLSGTQNVTITANGPASISMTGAIGGNVTDIIANSGLTFSGDSPDFVGTVHANAGTTTAGQDSTGLQNVIYVNAGATYNKGGGGGSSTGLSTIAGLNDGTGGGGIVTRSGSGTRPLELGGTGNYSFSGSLQDNGAQPFTLIKTGAGTQILSGVSTYTGSTSIGNGTLQLKTATGGSMGVTTATFYGGTFFYDNTGASGVQAQAFGALTLTDGESTIKSTKDSATSATLTYASLTRSAGATANFVVNGGTNGSNHSIVLTAQATNAFISQGTFFNGSNYAFYDAGGFVRGIAYTGTPDAGAAQFAVAGASAASTAFLQVTADVTAQATGTTFTTINLSGTPNFTLAASALVNTNGLLKSGGGSSTISGGTGIRAASGVELVIRTDLATDQLTINTPITAVGTNALTKSGAGTLVLGATNTYTGTTLIDGGVLSAGANANLGLETTGANLRINNGTLRATQSFGLFNGSAGTNNRSVILRNTATFDVANAATLTIASAITDNWTLHSNGAFMRGILAKTGLGTLALSSANTYAGGTAVNQGTLDVQAAANLSTGDVTVGNGGTLQLDNSTAINDLADLAVASGGTVNLAFSAVELEVVRGLTLGATVYAAGSLFNSGNNWGGFGNAGGFFAGSTGGLVVVPEPGCLSLVGLMGAGLLARRRRRTCVA